MIEKLKSELLLRMTLLGLYRQQQEVAFERFIATQTTEDMTGYLNAYAEWQKQFGIIEFISEMLDD